MLLYIFLLIVTVLIVAGTDNFGLLSGQAESTRNLSAFEILTYIFYQYVLNFPLSFFNWFSDKFLWSTYYFIVPNSLVVAWLVAKVLPYNRKEISRAMYYILIGIGMLVFTSVGYTFIKTLLAS